MSMAVHLHLGAKASVTARVWPPLADLGDAPYATLDLCQQSGEVVHVYVASAELLREVARQADRVAADLADTLLQRDLAAIGSAEASLRGEAAA